MQLTALIAVVFLFAAPPAAGMEAQVRCDSPENFVADDRYRQIAEAYALDAVDAARMNFGVELDWSDASVSRVEEMLSVMHQQLASARPSQETIETFSKMFGSYVGEVFRRNHGATWGLVTIDGETFAGMRDNQSCALFWPWGRVQNRLTAGDEHNVWHYYQTLLERDAP